MTYACLLKPAFELNRHFITLAFGHTWMEAVTKDRKRHAQRQPAREELRLLAEHLLNAPDATAKNWDCEKGRRRSLVQCQKYYKAL